MLTRRQFIHVTGPAILASVSSADKSLWVKTLQKPQSTSEGQEANMYVGTQQSCTPDMLQFYKRCGVNHICGKPEKWTREDILELKERCISNGITLDMVPIGMPRTVGLLGDKAYRDMQIE